MKTLTPKALFTDGVLEVAAVGVPDERLGELVAAVVVVKSGGSVTEESLIALARTSLPHFAVPVMVAELEHGAVGKLMKGEARKIAAQEWAKRSKKTKAML
ncbi:hypothetical protein C8F01DRAFT_993259 [Mycena amicta]|nr:hypothetical protein C8F01DRAFT_993259 [Mycena amicta]